MLERHCQNAGGAPATRCRTAVTRHLRVMLVTRPVRSKPVFRPITGKFLQIEAENRFSSGRAWPGRV